ncbi:autophagy-related protein [Favolaschia claudopus]|uniref:Autophagy-related protein n=1 Tax=Favolaschia claudopus TaxID=2862362 RepID=A0AAW0CZX1_9AGAR
METEATTGADTGPNFWLLKAEPDSRIVKGKDVKFSVDDFEAVKTSPWEGVRNYEARNSMQKMKLGEKALFYHSNCKNPGIAAFAEILKEAYPDHTAWDSEHPYYDPKTKQDDPKWFMVDLKFVSRAQHFVPLALLRFITDSASDSPPAGLEYLGDAGVAAIKAMDLTTRGRLSVQPVSEAAWTAIQQLASTGGWDELDLNPKKKSPAKKSADTADRPARAAKTKAKAKKRKAKGSDSEDEDEDYQEEESDAEVISKTTSARRKRKAPDDYQELPPTRRRAKASSQE